ncbi:hypothetical protein AA106555_0667 [Neokomagataea thailandica NBRC 106555]|uniref:Calcium-binding protein n=2 Tax=Neokomagataea TaxID=1223423 RepID=A0A4Y6V7C3_9PROT|nr:MULTISPECIES: calcium-binding protein [Neokomagataea]QDH24541.1 calcium-binding protein [Neokomagataea tanensis]GBR51742.1 hypothetical protein AA106555_0667 [Neokomagataea thailandica NBRC 106555]
MAVVTVHGTTARTLAVTVDGARAQALANQYASGINSQFGANSSSVIDLVAGTVSSGSYGHGAISEGGNYSIGGSLSNITVGAYDVVDTLNAAVSIDLTQSTASGVSIIAGDWAGVTVNPGSQSGIFVGGVGNNLFAGSQASGNWNIATGSGNDTINATNGNNTIAGGTGYNLITVGSGTNSVLSEGQDTIRGTSGTNTVTLLGGSSLVSLGANSTIIDGAQDNNVSFGTNSYVTAGSASSYFSTGSISTVVGGLNDTISATGNLQVVRGSTNNISVSGALSFLNGTGSTTITAGTSTIFGATALNAQLVGSGTSLFVGNDGGETVSGASYTGVLHAFAGTGNDSITGGTGADTLVGGTGNATLTGGTGAANLFALNKGSAGGNYTIEDFGSAAGNLMALYQYGLQNNNGLQSVLQNATVAGGNTTIQLSDNSKITFVGVTNLKASNFTLS